MAQLRAWISQLLEADGSEDRFRHHYLLACYQFIQHIILI